MPIVEMQKVNMAALKSVSDELINKLQELGCCQFIPVEQSEVDEASCASLRERFRKVEDLLGEVRFASRFLEQYATNKGSDFARALGDIPSHSLNELEGLASEENFYAVSSRVSDLEKKLSDARSALSRVRGLIAQLSPLSALPYSLDLYAEGTEKISTSLMMLPKTQVDAFQVAMSAVLGDMAEIFLLPSPSEKDTGQAVSLIYPREREEDVQEAVSRYTTTRIDVPPQLHGTAAEEIERLNEELELLVSSEAATTGEILKMANDAYTTCQYCSDYWTIQKDKLESLFSGEQTEQIILLAFWIPKNCLDAFSRATEPYASSIETIYIEPDEDEQPPILLKNKKFADSIELLVQMYGMPEYGGIDPTAAVTPFFFMFFGICFGDAGYGLLVASLLTALILKKKVTGKVRKFLQLIIIGNVCAFIFGAISFSWFGDSITSFGFLSGLKPLQKLQIFDPMNDPMTMLAFSLALGFIQIMFGLLLAMRENLKRGDRVAAFADQGGWMIFVCGLALVVLSSVDVIGIPTKVCGAIAIAGALILVATQGRAKKNFFGKLFSGVLSLYNVTGYLGDILSYSRLLALGLGSAAVGSVVNLLANLVSDIPGVGLILAVLIFILGHTFGIVINILGAFVHSLRLQYVEFFGKFYEAAGSEFTPLSLSTQYVKVSK